MRKYILPMETPLRGRSGGHTGAAPTIPTRVSKLQAVYSRKQGFDDALQAMYSRKQGFDGALQAMYSRKQGFDGALQAMYSRKQGFDDALQAMYSRKQGFDGALQAMYSRRQGFDGAEHECCGEKGYRGVGGRGDTERITCFKTKGHHLDASLHTNLF